VSRLIHRLCVLDFLTIGVNAALRQLLEFRLFYGDPHPGNIFAMRDGRIAYVDFGNVLGQQIQPALQENLTQLQFKSMIRYPVLVLAETTLIKTTRSAH